ncbi:molybdenum cofactor biosynthesis protein MoaE [Williamsia deligens]|uniref:Molybdenum cofactor biosynthesis protein MoaE n=1 Tax=Williamsia deligens TaxID=321325 RepID=A0ABW3G8D8_9NOCA|nr:molybdenum cofactor biosynthesis protein MoaE [Williamsia deligens]MCP2192843.1 molybdopterin synthase catalytic subunit [Williamsia deligens]
MSGARVTRAVVTADVLDPDDHQRAVHDDAAGAVVCFTGAVRDHDSARSVRALHYSAHPTAEQVLADVVTGIAAESDGARAIAVSHRVGDLAIGDIAFVVAVSADHRRAAFEVCSRVVDDVKAALPVWKHQMFADGTDEWVGSA